MGRTSSSGKNGKNRRPGARTKVKKRQPELLSGRGKRKRRATGPGFLGWGQICSNWLACVLLFEPDEARRVGGLSLLEIGNEDRIFFASSVAQFQVLQSSIPFLESDISASRPWVSPWILRIELDQLIENLNFE